MRWFDYTEYLLSDITTLRYIWYTWVPFRTMTVLFLLVSPIAKWGSGLFSERLISFRRHDVVGFGRKGC